LIKTIAIYRTRGIGDVILSFNGLHYLLQHSVKIYFIGYGPSLTLINHFFPAIHTIDIGKHGLRKSSSIINSKIKQLDAFIDLQVNSRSILLSIILWFRYRMPKYRLEKRSLKKILVVIANRFTGRRYQFRFVKNYRQPAIETMMHECIMKSVSGVLHDVPTDVKNTDTRSAQINNCKDSKTLVIAPGGSHAVKHISPELIVSVLEHLKLSGVQQFNICLIGDENDVAVCSKLEQELTKNYEVQNLTSSLNITELPKLLSKASVLLVSDSAVSHLGRYLHVPVAVIMGSTLEGFGYGLSAENYRVFSSDIACRPCSRHGHRECRYGDIECIKKINAKEIAGFLKKYLK
jgi:ADP-heptose:LPS heptosyltransferase